MGILGIDLGGTNVRVGLIKDNLLVRVESLPITKTDSAIDVVNDIAKLIERFSGDAIKGIGIGVPSVVDVENGVVYDVQNIPSWKEVHLKELLEDRFKLPVYVNNDANCFAAGEKYFGKGKNYKNIVGLIIGTGMGAGIIIHDKLYAGKNCGAGEFGTIPYKDKTYEYFCSGQFFTDEFNTTGEELFLRAGTGDKEAIQIFTMYGANLGEAVKLIMYALDPEIIILGGSVSKSFAWFKESMFESISHFSYAKSISNIKIEVSEIENVAILGAAALYHNGLVR